MTQIIVDESRHRKAQKRGGNLSRHPYEEILTRYQEQGLEVASLHSALIRLEELHSRQSEVVQMQWFLDFTNPHIADALDVSLTTVAADWSMAKGFL